MTGSRRAGAAVLRAFLVAAFTAATLTAAAQTARAQQPQSPLQARVIVTGEGSITVAPDEAQIRGGVVTRGKTAKEATAANSKLMEAITAALLDSGIEQKDIRTSHFSVQPIYVQQQNAEPKLSGFSVSNQVNVTIRQIAKVGDVLDRLITAGATDTGNIEFMHADPAKTLDAAREAAVADARRKAELYAHAAGLALGRVTWITEDPGYAPPMPMARMSAAAAPAPVPISPGEDTLRVRITVGFDIAP
jgi:uncharacterized protein